VQWSLKYTLIKQTQNILANFNADSPAQSISEISSVILVILLADLVGIFQFIFRDASERHPNVSFNFHYLTPAPFAQ
jgi:hypothetical protein